MKAVELVVSQKDCWRKIASLTMSAVSSTFGTHYPVHSEECAISLVSAMLTVSDMTAAVAFYQKAFGFTKRGIMNGPDGKPIHAELTLRGTTLMLGPENPALGKRSAKTVGASPAGLFLYVENVDKVVAKAVSLAATAQGQVMDMFWGDRCGTVVDPEGYTWMVGTHRAEPTLQEMKKKMKEQMDQQPSGTATAA